MIEAKNCYQCKDNSTIWDYQCKKWVCWRHIPVGIAEGNGDKIPQTAEEMEFQSPEQDNRNNRTKRAF
jgi:hypothetical protein